MLEFLSLYPTSATALYSLKHLDKNPFVEAHFIHLTQSLSMSLFLECVLSYVLDPKGSLEST